MVLCHYDLPDRGGLMLIVFIMLLWSVVYAEYLFVFLECGIVLIVLAMMIVGGFVVYALMLL